MSDVPDELWLEILSYMPICDVRPLSQCCSTLRKLTIPILFKTFFIRPFQENHGVVGQALALLRPTESEKKGKECLKVLALPYISLVVETLAIMPHGITLQTCHDSAQRPFKEIEPLIDQIIEFLPNVPNLTHLICAHTYLPKKRINTIVELPLKRLHLLGCTLSGKEPVTAQGSGTLEEINIDIVPKPVLSFTERTHLFHALFARSPNLHRIYTTATSDAFHGILIKRPPSITTLNVLVEAISSPYLSDTLAACPSLKSIILRCSPERAYFPTMDPLQPNSIPNLESYAGPIAYVGLAYGRPKVTHIHIFHSDLVAVPEETIRLVPQTIRSFKCTSLTIGPYLFLSLHSHFSFSRSKSPLQDLTVLCQGFSTEFYGLEEALDDKGIVPLQSIQRFTFNAPIYTADHLYGALEKYIRKLLRVYPNLEEARFVHSPNCRATATAVWVRNGLGNGLENESGSGLRAHMGWITVVGGGEEDLWMEVGRKAPW